MSSTIIKTYINQLLEALVEGDISTTSSAYIKLLMILPFIAHPTGREFNVRVKSSIYTLNNNGDRILPCLTPF